MPSIDRPDAPVQHRAIAARPRAARPQPPPPGPARCPGFVAVPEALFDDVAAGKLLAVDACVFAATVDLPRQHVHFCRPSKGYVGSKAGACGDTVVAAWGRLGGDYLERVPVAVPDPDQPRNRTGWRIYFREAVGRPPFVAIPRALLKDVADGRLAHEAVCVYAATLRLRDSLLDDSCVCTRRQVGRLLRRGEATVRRSWGRLEALGHLRRVPPGPGDAAGWRTHFPRREGAVAGPPRGGAVSGGAPFRPKLDPFEKEGVEKTLNVGLESPGGIGEGTERTPVGIAPPDPDRRRAADRIIHQAVILRGFRLAVRPDGTLDPIPPAGSGPMKPEGRRLLAEYAPEVVAELQCRGLLPRPPRPALDPGGGGGTGALAPKLGAAERARLRRLVGGLAASAGPETRDELAGALVAAFGDRDPIVSARTYAGIAGEVQAGRIGAGCLIEAIERACGPRIRCRGAAFVDAVRRWLGTHGRAPGRRPSAAGPGRGDSA